MNGIERSAELLKPDELLVCQAIADIGESADSQKIRDWIMHDTTVPGSVGYREFTMFGTIARLITSNVIVIRVVDRHTGETHNIYELTDLGRKRLELTLKRKLM